MIKTALVPTISQDIETTLRADAEQCSRFQGLADGDATGRYAYLFGLACSRLAVANTAWLRLTPKAALVPELLDVLHRCAELLDDYSDVVDGDDGPLPNRAMSLLTDVEAAIAKAEQR